MELEEKEKLALMEHLKSMRAALKEKDRLQIDRNTGVAQMTKDAFSSESPIYQLMIDVQGAINKLERPELNTGVAINLDDLQTRFMEITLQGNSSIN